MTSELLNDAAVLSLVHTQLSAELFEEVGLLRDRQELVRWISHRAPSRSRYAGSLVWLDEERSKIEKLGAQIIHPKSSQYPVALRGTAFAPTCLVLKGLPVWTSRKCVSIVGAREPSWDVLDWMDRELRDLSQSEVVLVSGGARGVDQMAHRLALRNSAPTIAFLPSGLGAVYPPEFRSWISEILESGGAVVTEFACEQRVQKHHFERRNRLIAGISATTLVIQAAIASGTYITARHARDLGRDVAVVPGFPGDSRFLGSLQLLYDGALMVRNRADLDLIIGER